MEELKTRCKDMKVIVSAVDGIITEHLSPLDELGNTLFKSYCMKDFEAINEIKKMCRFVFISKDQAISYNFFRRKSIPFYYAPKSKKEKLVEIMRRYGATPENVIYVGCSYSDINSMKLSEVTFCTEDSPDSVKNVADYVLPYYGGCGVLCGLYEILKHII
jgi:3-deoxy-D-manno-octulosonate 8-phosphate phosphatase KdsC-like HAD superfamily phosphatase